MSAMVVSRIALGRHGAGHALQQAAAVFVNLCVGFS